MSSTMRDPWPYLTADVPGVPGSIKRDYADFVVEEIPAYEPCGKGDHVFFTIEKAGLATMQAVHDIARALGVPSRQIGVAGLKDARSVSRQTLSVEHVDTQRVMALSLPRIRVLAASRHTNKLRIGHLRGNRFIIRMRDVAAERLADVRAVLDRLARRGAPNYFGPQRFGSRGDTWQLGEALLRDDPEALVRVMCGSPCDFDTGPVLTARRLFDRGEYEAAARAWPGMFRDNIHVCRVMAGGASARKAVAAIHRNLKRFYVEAFQAWLFNRVLAERLPLLDRILPGDLAWKHANGAVFRVEDATAEQPRADRFEISPTGPLFGYRMTTAEREPGRLEARILGETGLTDASFGQLGPLSAPGGRRPLRFQPSNVSAEHGEDELGPFIELRFVLPSGCYATSLLREIGKEHLSEGRSEPE